MQKIFPPHAALVVCAEINIATRERRPNDADIQAIFFIVVVGDQTTRCVSSVGSANDKSLPTALPGIESVVTIGFTPQIGRATAANDVRTVSPRRNEEADSSKIGTLDEIERNFPFTSFKGSRQRGGFGK